jgi:hypothetical protein
VQELLINIMVAPAFPLAKLGFLAIKQISKPLANAVANRGRKSKIFRNFVVLPVAQFFHFLDVKVRMRILNLGKVTKVPKVRTNRKSVYMQRSELVRFQDKKMPAKGKFFIGLEYYLTDF